MRVRTIWLFGQEVDAEKCRVRDITSYNAVVSDSVLAFGGTPNHSNIGKDSWNLFIQLPTGLAKFLVKVGLL